MAPRAAPSAPPVDPPYAAPVSAPLKASAPAPDKPAASEIADPPPPARAPPAPPRAALNRLDPTSAPEAADPAPERAAPVSALPSIPELLAPAPRAVPRAAIVAGKAKGIAAAATGRIYGRTLLILTCSIQFREGCIPRF